MIDIRPISKKDIEPLAKAARRIWKEHYDSIIGPESNDYLIDKFQSKKAIELQIEKGYEYYIAWTKDSTEANIAGYMAIYPEDNYMYLSKLYLDKEYRGQGISHIMLDFVKEEAKKRGLAGIFLNVNKLNKNTIAVYEKLGFKKIKSEIIEVGEGHVMDDFVMRLDF